MCQDKKVNPGEQPVFPGLHQGKQDPLSPVRGDLFNSLKNSEFLNPSTKVLGYQPFAPDGVFSYPGA